MGFTEAKNYLKIVCVFYVLLEYLLGMIRSQFFLGELLGNLNTTW
jgi:hypothetical protein